MFSSHGTNSLLEQLEAVEESGAIQASFVPSPPFHPLEQANRSAGAKMLHRCSVASLAATSISATMLCPSVLTLAPGAPYGRTSLAVDDNPTAT